MSAASQTCAQVTSRDSHSATFSPASADGLRLCASPEYHLIPDSGQDHVLASHSVQQAGGREPQTSATCGRSSVTSSRSASLQSSLESRLRVLTDGRGSPLYALKWKYWDMQSGQPICALRASAHRTSGSDSGLSGWATPTTRDHKDGKECKNAPVNCLLGRQVWLTGIPTPTATQSTGLPRRMTAFGELLIGFIAGTRSGGVLSQEHSRWLMGYPKGWHTCGVTEMPSCRKSRRRSSKQP